MVTWDPAGLNGGHSIGMPKSSSLSSDDISGLLKSESDLGVWDHSREMEGDGGGGVQRGVVTFESECGFLDC